MLKWSFEILNDFILSCSAQVIISQEVAKWLKTPAQGKILKSYFFNWNIFIFDALINIHKSDKWKFLTFLAWME